MQNLVLRGLAPQELAPFRIKGSSIHIKHLKNVRQGSPALGMRELLLFGRRMIK